MKKSPDPLVLEREVQIVKLRRQGHTWDEIAQQLGYADKSGPQKAYLRAAARVVQEDIQDIRALEAERLDNLQNAYWLDAMAGDVPAGTQVLRIMERRAKLLGLDSPIKQQVEVITYDASNISEHLRTIAAGLAYSHTQGQLDNGTSEAEPDTTGE